MFFSSVSTEVVSGMCHPKSRSENETVELFHNEGTCKTKPRRGAASGVTEFSNVVFSYFMSQNNPLVLAGFYQNLHHHASKAKFSISHRFFVRKICRTPA
jgi:hypothetical protein